MGEGKPVPVRAAIKVPHGIYAPRPILPCSPAFKKRLLRIARKRNPEKKNTRRNNQMS